MVTRAWVFGAFAVILQTVAFAQNQAGDDVAWQSEWTQLATALADAAQPSLWDIDAQSGPFNIVGIGRDYDPVTGTGDDNPIMDIGADEFVGWDPPEPDGQPDDIDYDVMGPDSGMFWWELLEGISRNTQGGE